MSDHNKAGTPHNQAISAYGSAAQKHTHNPRELEVQVLLKSAKMIKDLQDNWDNTDQETIEETLKYNRQIWLIFYENATENPDNREQDEEFTSNIINLANFIFKRQVEVMAENAPQKLDVIININREIAAGLMTQ